MEHNDQLSQRKSPRLKEYDYSQNGAYFVTVCTHDRRNIFSDIVGAIHESPEIKLKPYGRIAEKYINILPVRFDINVLSYVIMPDHIHLLISVENQDPLRAIHESPLQQKSLLSKIMGFLKMNVSRDIHLINPNEDVWQRSYYDHIVRNKSDLIDIHNYISSNHYLWFEGKHDDTKFLR